MALTRHVIACGEPADVVTASFFADPSAIWRIGHTLRMFVSDVREG
jgi:hypothetical protein